MLGAREYLAERDLAISEDNTTPRETKIALGTALLDPRHDDSRMLGLAEASIDSFRGGDHVKAASYMNEYMKIMQTHNDLIRQHLGDSHRWTIAHDKAMADKKGALDEYADLSMIENPMVKDAFDNLVNRNISDKQFKPPTLGE